MILKSIGSKVSSYNCSSHCSAVYSREDCSDQSEWPCQGTSDSLLSLAGQCQVGQSVGGHCEVQAPGSRLVSISKLCPVKLQSGKFLITVCCNKDRPCQSVILQSQYLLEKAVSRVSVLIHCHCGTEWNIENILYFCDICWLTFSMFSMLWWVL